MSWAIIKSSINDDLGKEDFLAINEWIMLGHQLTIPSKKTASTIRLARYWSSTTPSNVAFSCYTGGQILLRFNLTHNGNYDSYIEIFKGNELLEKITGNGELNIDLPIEINIGDTIKIMFTNPGGFNVGGRFEVYGIEASHYAIREA